MTGVEMIGGSSTRWRRNLFRRAAATALAGVLVVASTAAMEGSAVASVPPIRSGGQVGVGHITDPGVPCSAGGSGASRTFQYEAPLAAGQLSGEAATLHMALDVHIDDALASISAGQNAWLSPETSRMSIGNSHGVVVLSLDGHVARPGIGGCPQAGLRFDGTTVSGTGIWSVVDGQGSYRGASGAGTFTMSAGLAPGTANPWTIDLQGGPIKVTSPKLEVKAWSSYWGGLGVDYLARTVTVQYTIHNSGGDAFAVVLQGGSAASGITMETPAAPNLGDLSAGSDALLTVRYKIGLLASCGLLMLGCSLNPSLTFSSLDALGNSAPQTVGPIGAKAPSLPPPL